MTPVHVVCRTPHTFKVVIADDGGLALVRWCVPCACALATDECDPAAQEIVLTDVPPEMVAALVVFDDSTVN